MERTFVLFGAVFALLGVALGAFGSHGLRGTLEPRDLEIFETGVRYQLIHALALVAAGWAVGRWPGGGTVVAGWAFVLGILVFSGSLYVLVLSGTRAWGAVTPVGGVAFLVGWAALAWRVWQG